MKKLILLPFILFILQVSSQEKLIQYNDKYLKNIKIAEIPTNRELSDFGPCIVNGQLFFTAFNDDAKTDTPGTKADFYYQLFSVDINNVGNVTSMRNVISELASEYHVGPNSFDMNSGELMVTRNNADDPSITPFKPVQKKLLNLEMIVASEENGQWQFQDEFNHNNKDYSIGHPAYTPSGDTLIFVSDMPGGMGETDLYMSVRLNDGWSHPKNMGSGINSPGKEFTPFVTQNGMLIFASNGLEDNEDLDLYFTLLDQTENPTIIKFPSPINSKNDDFGMVIDVSHVFGYFTSNREGTGSDDIYRIGFDMALAGLSGKVINKITKEPINQSAIQFDPPVVNPETVYTDSEGLFEVDVPESKLEELIVSKDGFKTEYVKVTDDYLLIELMPEIWLELSVRDAETQEYISNVDLNFNGEETLVTPIEGIVKRSLDPEKEYYIRGTHHEYLDNSITIGANGEPGIIKATLWMYKGITGKTFVLENIYYDFDKWDILPQSAEELDKLVNILKENEGLKLQLGSHTDSRGSTEYNEWLANTRSQSAVEYILSKGISSNDIVAKGYGESRPYIDSPRNEVEHRLNRRTTFTILELGSNIPKFASVHSNQSMYGKYSTQPLTNRITPVYKRPKYELPLINVSGKNYRVQFYASVKPININLAMTEVVEKFSHYGIINLEEDFLIKYQIGPFTDKNEGTSIYNRIKSLGYQVMLLEYEDNTRTKMVLPN
ncbi:MAG: OmpA family protein [Mariniphaga sp.]|nr:OmpA family protein [Mariniphaga sp.]